jgi:hypothetical protein
MSYILDALKKAEQERGGTRLQAVTSGHADRTFSRNRWWPIAGALTICAAALICFLLLFTGQSKQVVSPSQAVTAKQPDANPAVTHSPAIAPAAVVPSKSSNLRPAAASLTEQSIPERTMNNGNYSNAPKQIPVIPKPNEPATSMIQDGRADSSRREASPPSPETPASAPAALREAILKMKLTVLLDSETPSERVVFINGRKYKEGDYVDGHYLLEKISLEGAELSYKEERMLLRH